MGGDKKLASRISLAQLEDIAEDLDAAKRERPKMYSAVEVVRAQYRSIAEVIELHGIDRAVEILHGRGLKITKSTLRKYMRDERPVDGSEEEVSEIAEEDLEKLTAPVEENQ